MGGRHIDGRRVTAKHAFLLGALMALVALAPAYLPYAGRFVTRGDYIEQQLPFLAEARRILRAGPNAYSFATFLGAPAIGSYAFYTLGSPFVWPLALVPKSTLPYAVTVMAVLKHAVCALSAFCYFRRMLRDGEKALLGAILYAFSSFTVVNTQFYHFTEVVAFFPLILLGMEDAMGDAPRPGLLALACALNTLTNYYFMLGSALLAALYFAFRLFSDDWKPARTPRRVGLAVFECAVGCALAGALLLPAMRFMLSITRTGAGDTPLLAQRYSLATLLERLRALVMPIESGVVHAFYGDAPSWSSTAAHLPVFGLTGALALFAARGRARWLKALLLALLAACCVPALCGAFSLWTNAAYTRWWYGVSLLTALATLYALRDAPPEARPRAWRAAFAALTLLAAALTLPFMLPEAALSWLDGALPRLAGFLRNRRTGAYAPGAFRALSLALALLGGGAMLLRVAGRLRGRALLLAVCAVACCQYAAYIAAGDALILSGGETPGGGTLTLSEIAEPTLAALEMPEPEAYKRIDYGAPLRNYGLLRGDSSLTCFSSLRTSTVGRFVSMAGFGYDESTTVRPPDGSPALRAFLSVTEYHALSGEPAPEGFVYDREEGGHAVYANPAAVPMGFLQTVVTGTHAQRMDAETVGGVLLAAAALDEPYLSRFAERLSLLDVYAVPDWAQSAARLRESACDRFITRADGFSAHIDAKDAGLVVFTIPYDKGFSATLDGAPAEIVPCDVAFMALFVEPGEHDIDFTFRTRSLPAGIALSAAAALVLVAYVTARKRKRA